MPESVRGKKRFFLSFEKKFDFYGFLFYGAPFSDVRTLHRNDGAGQAALGQSRGASAPTPRCASVCAAVTWLAAGEI